MKQVYVWNYGTQEPIITGKHGTIKQLAIITGICMELWNTGTYNYR